MPELPEVHRATHFLRQYLVTPSIHTLSKVAYYSPPDNKNSATLSNDPKIFDTAKTGTDAASFSKALQGKKIKDVGRLGKYFWLEMESPPHPVFHFGMTGWVKYKGSKGKGVDYWEGKVEGRNGEGANKKAKKSPKTEDKEEGEEAVDGVSESDNKPQEVPEDEWPPRFTKVLFEATAKSGEATEFAFVDGRRFSKILLVHPEKGKSIRETEPLASNGPDPLSEAEQVTPEWLGETVAKRKVPIKAFLLDQHALSGVGNWVADEVLFHAGVHPEKHANALTEDELKRLADQLKSVCRIAAVDALGDSHKFPDDWLMRHRWRLDKTGNAGILPSGEKIIRITVGGRTSAVVPSRQGQGPNGIGKQDEGGHGKSSKKRKSEPEEEDDDDGEESANAMKEDTEDAKPTSNKRQSARRSGGRNTQAKPQRTTDTAPKKQKTSKQMSDKGEQTPAQRRSGRGSKK